jgi:signal transduction histidine kinase
MPKSIPLLQSLRCRLIVSVVIIEVVMLSILVLNNISIIQTTHTDRLRDTANSMIQQIANTSGNYMVAVDYATLEDYLKNVINYKELLYLAVFDRDDNMVISLGPFPQHSTPHADATPAQTDDNIFDITEEIQVAGQPMGKVLAGFSLSLMQEAIHKSRVRGISIAVIEIGLTVLVTVIIGLGLTRRLGILSNAAAEVEAGNYSVTIPTEIEDEVGKTATAFNRMVAEVSNRTQQLQKAESRSTKLLHENRQLIHTSLEIQEAERKHLARELHDELGQCLTAIQADAELIRDISNNDSRIKTSATAIMDVSSRVYNVVHSMMHRLRPGILDNLGLVEALKDEINAWQCRHTETRCNFSCQGDLSALGEHTNITLYRIIQECLTNISKHANADIVDIELRNDTDRLLLKVSDNGNGFNMQSNNRGLGLIGMRERVESLNGKLQLESEPAKGVIIMITVPLE